MYIVLSWLKLISVPFPSAPHFDGLLTARFATKFLFILYFNVYTTTITRITITIARNPSVVQLQRNHPIPSHSHLFPENNPFYLHLSWKILRTDFRLFVVNNRISLKEFFIRRTTFLIFEEIGRILKKNSILIYLFKLNI